MSVNNEKSRYFAPKKFKLLFFMKKIETRFGAVLGVNRTSPMNGRSANDVRALLIARRQYSAFAAFYKLKSLYNTNTKTNMDSLHVWLP